MLKECYAELRTELVKEIEVIEERILKPATDARTSIAPIRKTIKKREAKRVEYEKLQDKSMKLHRKPGKTPKEDAALAKLEGEMAQAGDVSFDPPALKHRPILTTRSPRNSALPMNICEKPFRRS